MKHGIKQIFKLTLIALVSIPMSLMGQVDPPHLEVEDQDQEVGYLKSGSTTTRLSFGTTSYLLNGSNKRAQIETADQIFRLSTSNNNQNGQIRFATHSDGTPVDRMTISQFGNVGIGNLGPLTSLHVTSNFEFPLILQNNNTNGNYMLLQNSGTYIGYMGSWTGNGLGVDDMQVGTPYSNGKTYLVCGSQPKLSVDFSGNVTINEVYTLPNGDGTAGQVLTTDGAGTVTWDDGGGNPVAFAAHLNGDVVVASGAGSTTLTSYIEEYDNTGAFNPTTGIFTAPEAGTYSFTAKWVLKSGNSSQSGSCLMSFAPNWDVRNNYVEFTASFSRVFSQTTQIQMNAGQSIRLDFYNNLPGNVEILGSGNSYFRTRFTGHKVN